MTQRLLFTALAGWAAVSACAEVQRIPDEPRYSAPSVNRSAEPKPPAEQRVRIAVRHVEPPPVPVTHAAMAATATAAQPASVLVAAVVTEPASKLLEARLADAPACNEMLVERMDGVRPIRHELAQEDKILMWSGYGGAGLVALLTTIGMARGQDPGRGVLLFGIYGLPLAGVGAYETWRMRTIEEPVDPRFSAARQVGELPCPKGSDSLPARVVLSADKHTDLNLTREWATVPGGEQLAVRYDAATEMRTVLRDGRLTAFLGAPLRDEAPAPATSSVETPTTTSAATPTTAAVLAPPTSEPVSAPPCAEVAVQTKTSGWLPKAFFEQPLKDAELLDGVSLEDFAGNALGGKHYLWQVQELNPGLSQALEGARPIKVKVPAQVKSAMEWKSLLPPTCE